MVDVQTGLVQVDMAGFCSAVCATLSGWRIGRAIVMPKLGLVMKPVNGGMFGLVTRSTGGMGIGGIIIGPPGAWEFIIPKRARLDRVMVAIDLVDVNMIV